MFEQYDDLFRQMEQEMERVSEQAFRRFDRALPPSRVWQPRVDLCETEDALCVIVELAGLSPETISRQINVELSSDNRTLTISGRRDEPPSKSERTRCHQLEIYYGDFERNISLPHQILIRRENMSASYRHGLLTVHLPKRPREEPVRVPVERGRSGTDAAG